MYCLVLYILLISIIVVTVLFLCCSVKLSFYRLMSFAFFFPFSSPAAEGVIEQPHGPLLLAGAKPQQVPPPPPSSLTLASAGLFHFFSLLSLTAAAQHFLPCSKHVIKEAPPTSLIWAQLWPAVGTFCSQMELTVPDTGTVFSLFSHRPPLQTPCSQNLAM